MEEDRAIADLGPDLPPDLNGEEAVEEKQPKRRFIGRRAAESKAAAAAGATAPQEQGAGIEESGAIQGATITFIAPSQHTGN